MLADSDVRIRFGAIWWWFLFSIFWFLHSLTPLQFAMMLLDLSAFASYGVLILCLRVLFGRHPQFVACVFHSRSYVSCRV
jgi:hypothetical protein